MIRRTIKSGKEIDSAQRIAGILENPWTEIGWQVVARKDQSCATV